MTSTPPRSQDLLLALSEAPGVKVRLFNPFCCGGSGVLQRFVASPNFMQLNHRMHNKLFIADSAMAVVGGRNIADEYFVLSPAQNFIDMDALVVGEVLPQLGRMSAAWRPLRTWPTGTSRSRCWPIRWPRRMSRLCTPAMRATASVCSRATWTSTS